VMSNCPIRYPINPITDAKVQTFLLLNVYSGIPPMNGQFGRREGSTSTDPGVLQR